MLKICSMLIVIMHNFVIPAVMSTVLIVRSTPCLSIQLAMSPGIIFPITIKSVVPKPAVIIFSDLDRYPNRKPISNANTNLLFRFVKLLKLEKIIDKMIDVSRESRIRYGTWNLHFNISLQKSAILKLPILTIKSGQKLLMIFWKSLMLLI